MAFKSWNSLSISSFTWFVLAWVNSAAAFSLPSVPTDPAHPGSKVYSYGFEQKSSSCLGRSTDIFLPSPRPQNEKFPLVVFGHGQALGLEAYQGTLEHLAKKGIVALFPKYDTGFFDQQWTRMGSDYVMFADCVAAQLGMVDAGKVIYAGHSKGAYVAGIAAGLASGIHSKFAPKEIILFEPAGSDLSSLATIAPETALTVVFSDGDTIVAPEISETIFQNARSARKQLIHLKSYSDTQPSLRPDHFWPLTESTIFGGGPEGPFHYYGSWKWLVAAARDLEQGGRFEEPYLYGALALDKGLPGHQDQVKRNWSADGNSDL